MPANPPARAAGKTPAGASATTPAKAAPPASAAAEPAAESAVDPAANGTATEPAAGATTGPTTEPVAVPATGPPARSRLRVRKTYKLYVGGAFPRSESGRSYQVTDATGEFVANAALASRKDVRDAVLAARKAFGGWAGRTAYNRGQILYRVAEMLEGRREQFVELARRTDQQSAVAAPLREVDMSPECVVDAAIDRWVWYAGWADKVAQVHGNANPVAGPFFNVSSPEPTGVVGVVAPPQAPLLGLVSVLAPVILSGNTAVVLASEQHPLPAITLAEVLATSDLPGGVVNLLTGRPAETAPWLANHMDVNGLDLTGVGDAVLAADLERAAAENLKRVTRPNADVDWLADPGAGRLTTFLETKTVWHPKGS